MKQKKKGILRIGIVVVAVFAVVAFIGIVVAHGIVFCRVDYSSYASDRYYVHEDLDEEQYPRREVDISSENNMLRGYLYGRDASKGLVVISPGHKDASDIKLYEVTYFVDAGWQVLVYDYTGCYDSQGNSAGGYTQSVYDLDAVLTWIEGQECFDELPVMLFGHSLGAYASAAVLQYDHKVDAAVIASGFDTPQEQWSYSIERHTGVFHYVLQPFTELFISIKYGADKKLSAVEGINSVDIPILVISGTDDEYYGADSPIYRKRDEITNPNCCFMYMTEENHNGHYDYFLTDEALAYQDKLNKEETDEPVDKDLYMEHDTELMKELNLFYESVLSKSQSE